MACDKTTVIATALEILQFLTKPSIYDLKIPI